MRLRNRNLVLWAESRCLNLFCEPQQACWTRREDPARPLDSTDNPVSTSEDTGWGGDWSLTWGYQKATKLHQAGSGEGSVLAWVSDSKFDGDGVGVGGLRPVSETMMTAGGG